MGGSVSDLIEVLKAYTGTSPLLGEIKTKSKCLFFFLFVHDMRVYFACTVVHVCVHVCFSPEKNQEFFIENAREPWAFFAHVSS